MAPLRSLQLPSLNGEVLQFFASHGIISVEDFLIHDLYTLAAIAEHQSRSEILKQAIAEILHFVDNQHGKWFTGEQLLNSLLQDKRILPTGCEGVDLLLGGGLLEGTVTELVGPSASGKTQYLMQICLRAASHIAYHSEAAVMFLDTCNSFSSERITDFLGVCLKSSMQFKDQQGNFERTMKEIFHFSVFDIHSMLNLLHQIESSVKNQGRRSNPRLSLLIVDSVSSVINPILSGGNLQGHSLMISLGLILKKLALDCNLAVLITNHTVIDKSGMLRPALGESWKTVPHVRLLLYRDPVDDFCDITLIKHTSKACYQHMNFCLKN